MEAAGEAAQSHQGLLVSWGLLRLTAVFSLWLCWLFQLARHEQISEDEQPGSSPNISLFVCACVCVWGKPKPHLPSDLANP